MRLSTFATVGIALALGASAAEARNFTFRTLTTQLEVNFLYVGAAMNNAGTVVFPDGDYPHDMAIYINDGTETRVLVSEDTSPYVDLFDPVINDNGLVAFRARIPGRGWGIFATTDGAEFAALLDPNHPIGLVSALSLNNNDEVAFWGRIGADYYAIFKTDGAAVTTIADDVGELDLSDLDHAWPRHTSINDSGVVAFCAEFDGGGQGILRGDGTNLETIATTGDVFDHFSTGPAILSNGDVLFSASLVEGGEGIYRSDGTVITPVMEPTGELGSVSWDSFACANEQGQVLVRAYVDHEYSWYVGPEPETRRVIRNEERFYGTRVQYASGLGLNDNGQALVHLEVASPSLDLLVVASPAPESPETIYVRQGADGTNEGTSWEDAFAFLQDALDFVAPPDQVWIAAGEYKPGQALYGTWTDRQVHFLIPAGVDVYGGFAGDETSLEERAGLFDQTILSGDLNGDDEPNFVNYEDNSYVVMIAGDGPGQPVTIDGLTVTAGSYGRVYSYPEGRDVFGAGLGVSTDVAVRNCRFVDNQSTYFYDHGAGGGAHVDVGTASFENCAFEHNTGRGWPGAGGAYISGAAAVTFVDCMFAENGGDSAAAGLLIEDCPSASVGRCSFASNPDAGAGVITSNVTFEECDFAANGGGLRVGPLEGGTVTLSGCAFAGNSAALGGAISYYLLSGLDQGLLTARACLFEGNRSQAGGALVNAGGNMCLDNCYFVQNTASRDGGLSALGGAVWAGRGSAVFRECVFIGNMATPNGYGGAVRVGGPGPTAILNCALWNNYADYGGAVSCRVASPTIIQSILGGNSAVDGGAIFLQWDAEPLLVNSVVAENVAEGHGGAFFSLPEENRPVIHNSILWGNEDQDGSAESSQIYGGAVDVRYSCVQGWTGALGGVGNLGDDPLFVDLFGPDGLPGTGDEDFHLSPGSPCIDRGSNWLVPFDLADLDDDGDLDECLPLDLDAEGRFFDDPNTPDNSCGAPIVDLGPYELGGSGPQPCVGDADGDGDVDSDDLACLLERYGREHTDPEFDSVCDFDADGVIGLRDLATLLSVYGMPCE